MTTIRISETEQAAFDERLGWMRDGAELFRKHCTVLETALHDVPDAQEGLAACKAQVAANDKLLQWAEALAVDVHGQGVPPDIMQKNQERFASGDIGTQPDFKHFDAVSHFNMYPLSELLYKLPKERLEQAGIVYTPPTPDEIAGVEARQALQPHPSRQHLLNCLKEKGHLNCRTTDDEQASIISMGPKYGMGMDRYSSHPNYLTSGLLALGNGISAIKNILKTAAPAIARASAPPPPSSLSTAHSL